MPAPLPRAASALVGSLVPALALLAGCTGDAPDPGAAPSDPATPLASYDTAEVAIVRAPYCDRVDETAVEEALGGPPRRASAWDNGDRVPLGGGTTDVAHEYGCTWSAGRARAGTWLFAPPVTGGQARSVLERARRTPGCEPDEQAPAFGAPSVALTCPAGPLVTASYRGLFGDAWLVCEVTGDDGREDVVQRAERWCVEVAEAARAS